MNRGSRNAAHAAAMIGAAALLLSGCSGSESDGESDDTTSSSAPQEQAVATTVRTGRVTGRLGKNEAGKVAAEVAAVVDAWHEAAYLGDYPRDDFAWPGFRGNLGKQARKDRALTSNSRIADRIDGVEPTARKVVVDMLAVKGNAVGATARFRLVFNTTGDLTQQVTVRGRLGLVPAKGGGWQVFEYDVARGKKGSSQ